VREAGSNNSNTGSRGPVQVTGAPWDSNGLERGRQRANMPHRQSSLLRWSRRGMVPSTTHVRLTETTSRRRCLDTAPTPPGAGSGASSDM
jgi:hypothetical protein